MEDLGTRLKQAREAQGISLKQIATKTKIAATALEALERNDFSRLPGGIFGRAFVRAYAIEIGMDPEATVRDFQIRLTELEREAAERGAVRPEVTADDREFLARQQRALRALRVGLIILALVLAAMAVWGLQTRRPKPQVVVAAPRASELMALPPVAPPVVARPDVAKALDVADGASDVQPAGIDGPVLPAPSLPAAGEPTISEARANGRLLAEIEASADGWVWAMVDGTVAVNRLFRTGDRQRLDVGHELRLDLANAGGVALLLNGARAKALGAGGERVKARITPDTLGQFVQ